MTTDLEKSFKAKLRNIAKEVDRNPADLWQSIVLERLLVRLGKSSYRDSFILKGGLLLSKYLPIGRETQDLDFLGRNISNNLTELEKTFHNIARISIDDGFVFSNIKVNQLEHEHMAYSGVEVSMMASFGRSRFPVQIDVGFGDRVNPVDKSISLVNYSKGPLFEEKINLLCYPAEFIFAEKLETVVYRGGVNSRMKDFHDLYTMLNLSDLLPKPLKSVLLIVFHHRQTSLNLPLSFSDKDIVLLQAQWARYLVRLRQKDSQILPKDISECIAILNTKLAKILN